jgi:uncharacterized damage-inducible protein DinB
MRSPALTPPSPHQMVRRRGGSLPRYFDVLLPRSRRQTRIPAIPKSILPARAPRKKRRSRISEKPSNCTLNRRKPPARLLKNGDWLQSPFFQQIAWHIVATEMRFMEAVAAGEFDLSPRPRPDSVKNSADLAGWYRDNFAPRFDKLTKLSNDQLVKIVDFRGMFQLPAVMYLNFLLHHSIHHRGQLSTYLRPMGAKVPAMYGESYDSAEARRAAQQTA